MRIEGRHKMTVDCEHCREAVLRYKRSKDPSAKIEGVCDDDFKEYDNFLTSRIPSLPAKREDFENNPFWDHSKPGSEELIEALIRKDA